MKEWISKLPEWESMTQAELKANKSGNKQGLFHDMGISPPPENRDLGFFEGFFSKLSKISSTMPFY